jgi:hypothetical protein
MLSEGSCGAVKKPRTGRPSQTPTQLPLPAAALGGKGAGARGRTVYDSGMGVVRMRVHDDKLYIMEPLGEMVRGDAWDFGGGVE